MRETLILFRRKDNAALLLCSCPKSTIANILFELYIKNEVSKVKENILEQKFIVCFHLLLIHNYYYGGGGGGGGGLVTVTKLHM